jgi:hypothetical protein
MKIYEGVDIKLHEFIEITYKRRKMDVEVKEVHPFLISPHYE